MQQNDNRGTAIVVTWVLSLAAIAGLLAIKFGWIDLEISPDNSAVVEQNEASSTVSANNPDWALGDDTQTHPVDPSIFNQQSEPDSKTIQQDEFLAAEQNRPGFQPGDFDASHWPPQAGRTRIADQPAAPPSNLRVRNSQTNSAPPFALQQAEHSPQTNRTAGHWEEPGQPNQTPRRTVERQSGVQQVHFEAVDDAHPVASAPLNLEEIDRLIHSGEIGEAHRKLSEIYWNQPVHRKQIQKRIDGTASVIFFQPQRHFMEPHEVQFGDDLTTIGKKYNVPWAYLARLNRAVPDRIQAGRKLKVIRGPFAALIDLSDFEMIIHAHGLYVARYQVGIGKDGSTPTGKLGVISKVHDPPYYGPDGLVIANDDPQNPLGERWIDLGRSYGIHGTINPSSIGRAESRGCIRMHNTDVEIVFDLLTIGSEVAIRQ